MRALQAVMDGHRVMPVADAARRGDIFVTVTGDKHVLRAEHFEVMRDGAIIANAGHFNVEVDVPALEAMAVERTLPRAARSSCSGSPDGRQIALLAEGRLVNLGAAEGHPASVMDMTFANQALSVEYAVRHGAGLERRVYVVPDEIDTEIARLKLRHARPRDRPAHVGAGALPGDLGRRHVRPRCCSRTTSSASRTRRWCCSTRRACRASGSSAAARTVAGADRRDPGAGGPRRAGARRGRRDGHRPRRRAPRPSTRSGCASTWPSRARCWRRRGRPPSTSPGASARRWPSSTATSATCRRRAAASRRARAGSRTTRWPAAGRWAGMARRCSANGRS